MVLVFSPMAVWMGVLALPNDLYFRITSVFYLFVRSDNAVILYNIRSTLGRFENYKEALKLFVANPVQGIGLGMYPHLTRFDDADGFYTGLLAETGIVGALGFLVFMTFVLVKIHKSLGQMQGEQRLAWQWFAALVGALLLVSFFEPVFKIQVMSFYFFFLLKAMTCEASQEADSP